MKSIVILGVAIMALAACAAGPKWDKIVPGMTGQMVMTEMKGGPSRIDPYAEGYSAWFYGEHSCILMQDDKVVSKELSEEKGGIRLFKLGASKEIKKAGCVPPGQQRAVRGGTVERGTATPFGTIKQSEE
ncbi:MAG: hypothetical protein HYT76_00020 [Deltaproteobacteria bacterium]|nr:hypothetical protein [Deltaproteobacteria bacterium]